MLFVSSFFAKKLDTTTWVKNNESKTETCFQKIKMAKSIADRIRLKIKEGGEGYWTYADFSDLPGTSVSKTLSRLAKEGALERIKNGIYYHPRITRFGRSSPSQSEIQKLAIENGLVSDLHPSGISAASLLGFTTQNSVQGEFATSASSIPRKVIGYKAKVHTRRPATWKNLSKIDAALLDFLRHRGEFSDLSPYKTKELLLRYFKEDSRFERILEIADNEPPRVRAMLGAIGQEIGKKKVTLLKLRQGLNQVSRYDFGKLKTLRYAKDWQAK
jgi:hypothetical protein